MDVQREYQYGYNTTIDNMIQFPISNQVKEIKTSSKSTLNRGTNKPGASNAIKDPNDVQKIKNYFISRETDLKKNRKSYGIRNYCLVTFGFNSGLRGGDILKIKIGDIVDKTGAIITDTTLKEKKTGKTRKLHLNTNMKEAVLLYLNNDKPNYMECLNEELFQSRECDKNGNPKSITIQRFWQLLKEAQDVLKIEGNISTHSCRKTKARMMIDNNPNNSKILSIVQDLLNHSSQRDTLRYLDISMDEINKLHDEFQL